MVYCTDFYNWTAPLQVSIYTESKASMATYALYGTKRAGSAAIKLALRRCDIPYRLVNAASWKPQSALGELAVEVFKEHWGK